MSAAERIADYALLGDCQGAALVSRHGSIDWWCTPRFDSRSVFARLLDPSAGHWSIRAAEEARVEREYVADTMVVATTFHTDGGVLRVTDALALAPGARGHDIGFDSPHALVRLVEAVAGEVTVSVEYAPRPEYGLVLPDLASTQRGIEVIGGPDTLLLSGDRPLEVDGERACGTFTLREGESAAFVLRHREGMSAELGEDVDPRALLEATLTGWRSWTELHRGYEGPYQAEVMRSALVLQALTYQPSGAVVAAATTSLPEEVGGASNWDYRFSWLRDASLTLKALWVAACPDEATRFFDWMARAAGGAGDSGHVQIVFGVQGERDLTEHQLDHLRGYQDSAPVRVGNDAWRQKQLDVLGEVLEGAYALGDHLQDLSPATARFLRGLADQAAQAWREPDAGIWEARDAERHYLTSKLLCWTALDRAIHLASQLGAEQRREDWVAAREEIRQAILDQGWNEDLGAYTGAFGSDHLDAAVLLMPLLDFVPATDERMARTIDAIERDLSSDGLVQRWTGATDGAFVICSYWLAACRARAGQVGRAREIFEAASAHANDVGLLSEEIDPHTGELIGNFPQAFSHVGLINAAWAIHQAEGDASGDGPKGAQVPRSP